MTKTEPRSAGSGGGRDKTQPTPAELLACPFCGAPASLSSSGAPVSYVHCLKCITCGPVGRTDAEAIAAWNSRATTLSAREDGWQLVPVEAGGAQIQSIMTQLGCDEEPAKSFWRKLLMWAPASLACNSGASLIAAERARQVSVEGWTSEHDDDEHECEALALAAACYSMPPDRYLRSHQPPLCWPWEESYWKPGDRIRELVKAGALCAAEIDRLQRAATKAPTAGEGQ